MDSQNFAKKLIISHQHKQKDLPFLMIIYNVVSIMFC